MLLYSDSAGDPEMGLFLFCWCVVPTIRSSHHFLQPFSQRRTSNLFAFGIIYDSKIPMLAVVAVSAKANAVINVFPSPDIRSRGSTRRQNLNRKESLVPKTRHGKQASEPAYPLSPCWNRVHFRYDAAATRDPRVLSSRVLYPCASVCSLSA